MSTSYAAALLEENRHRTQERGRCLFKTIDQMYCVHCSSEVKPRRIAFSIEQQQTNVLPPPSPPPPPPPRRRLTSGFACETCRRRKTKCDGGQPCAYCATNRIECVHRASKRRYHFNNSQKRMMGSPEKKPIGHLQPPPQAFATGYHSIMRQASCPSLMVTSANNIPPLLSKETIPSVMGKQTTMVSSSDADIHRIIVNRPIVLPYLFGSNFSSQSQLSDLSTIWCPTPSSLGSFFFLLSIYAFFNSSMLDLICHYVLLQFSFRHTLYFLVFFTVLNKRSYTTVYAI